MTTTTVTTQAQLVSALKTAGKGDKILLADGDYGSLALKTKAAGVSISAINPLGAKFDDIVLSGATNLAFDGIALKGVFKAWGDSANIAITNSKALYYYFREVDGVTVTGSEASDGKYGLLLRNTKDFVVTDNYFHTVTEDVVRIIGDSNGLFQNNMVMDTVAGRPTHPDLLQIYAYDGITPHDITIRGNYFYDDTTTGSVTAQGIFIALGEFSNILVEQNLVATPHANSIYVSGGQENVVIRNNTLISGEKGDGGGIIRLAKGTAGLSNEGVEVYGNVAKLINKETAASHVGENYLYGRNADKAALFSGLGDSWHDFVPVAGSAIDFSSGWGAIARLKQLLASGGGADTGAPDSPAVSTINNVLDIDGPLALSGRLGKQLTVAHDAGMEVDEATIALTFNADATGWRRGILSKDAQGLGDHFSIMLENGTLKLKVEDGVSAQTISVAGIKAKVDYDLLAQFEDGSVSLYLDGKLAGKVQSDIDLSHNTEMLVVGAENAASAAGTTSAARYAFDGTISHLVIYDEGMTPLEFQAQRALDLAIL